MVKLQKDVFSQSIHGLNAHAGYRARSLFKSASRDQARAKRSSANDVTRYVRDKRADDGFDFRKFGQDVSIDYSQQVGYNQKMDVSIAYAKNNLSALLKAVENGETVTISRYNKPIATIGPIETRSRPAPRFGMGKNIKILDPNWAKPMTRKQLEQFIDTGRY